MIKVISALLIVGLITGCASSEQSKPPCDFAAGRTVPANAKLTVRETEIIKVYKTGRYIDPNNPNIMHEAGQIYVISNSPTWNTRPNIPVNSPDFKNHLRPVNIQLENLKKQQALLQETNQVMQGLGNQMLKSRKELQEINKKSENRKDLKPSIERLQKAQDNIKRKLAELEK
jgi:regulator of replication initiation timing